MKDQILGKKTNRDNKLWSSKWSPITKQTRTDKNHFKTLTCWLLQAFISIESLENLLVIPISFGVHYKKNKTLSQSDLFLKMLHEAKTLACGGKICVSECLQVSQQTCSFAEDWWFLVDGFSVDQVMWKLIAQKNY